MRAAARATPRVISVAAAQAASSTPDQVRGAGAEHRPGPGAGAVPGRLRLAQRGLRSVPPPLIEPGEFRPRVLPPVREVGDQAEHLRHLLPLHGHVVLDDPHSDGDAVNGQFRDIGMVREDLRDPFQRDAAFEPDQHMGTGDEARDPGRAG